MHEPRKKSFVAIALANATNLLPLDARRTVFDESPHLLNGDIVVKPGMVLTIAPCAQPRLIAGADMPERAQLKSVAPTGRGVQPEQTGLEPSQFGVLGGGILGAKRAE